MSTFNIEDLEGNITVKYINKAVKVNTFTKKFFLIFLEVDLLDIKGYEYLKPIPIL